MEMGWLWITCAIISFLLITGSITVFFRKKFGIMRFLVAVGGGVLATYFIYVPKYVIEDGIMPGLLNNFVNLLKVISLDADLDASCKFVHQCCAQNNEVFSFIYEIMLATVHLLLPAIFAVTAVTMLMQCVSRLRLGYLRKSKKVLHVFSEVNYKSTLLAKDIRSHCPHDKIIFLEEDKEKDHTDLRESLDCVVLNETIENVRAEARKGEVHYYCISADEEQNINSALAILDDLQNLQVKGDDEAQRLHKLHEIQKRYKIYLFSASAITEPMVDSLDKGMVELDVINEYQSVAYQLLREHLLLDAADENKQISLLLCGFTEVTKELIRAASWCSQLPGYRLKIRIAGDISADAQADFRAAYPGLFAGAHDIQFYPCTNAIALEELLKGDCADAGYIVVAENAETRTIERAVELRRFFYRNDPCFCHAPKIFAHIENKDKANAVERLQTAEEKVERRAYYNIIPFGGADTVYTHHNITDSSLEWLAKNVHLEYTYTYLCQEQAKKPEDQQKPVDLLMNVDAELQKYNRFEVSKRSNRANALHIRYKLAALGLDYVRIDPTKMAESFGEILRDAENPAMEADKRIAAEDVALLSKRLNETDLLEMMIAEHDRWLVFHESEGWRPATIEQVKAYNKAKLSGGTHKCPLLKMHPYICGFDELKQRAIQLGKEDSTIYDRSLIVNIPAIISGQRRGGETPIRRFRIVERK